MANADLDLINTLSSRAAAYGTEAAAATYLKVKVDAGDCTQNCVEAKNWLAGWRGCHVRF